MNSTVRTIALLIGSALASGAPAAHAQKKLTFDEAIALARAQNRELGAQRARLDASETGIAAARGGLFPRLDAQGKYTHNNEEAAIPILTGFDTATGQPIFGDRAIITKQDQLDAVVIANVPLIAPATWSSVSAAKKTHEAAVANTAVGETSVLMGVAASFYLAAGADEVLAARKNNVEVAKRTLQDASARVEAGAANRVEVTRAQLAVVRAEQSAKEAADARARAYRALATQLQLREEFTVSAPGEAGQASGAGAVEETLARRPEIVAWRTSADAARAQRNAARLRIAPTLAAFGNFRQSNYEGLSGETYAWAVGAQLDWSLFDGGLRYAQSRAAFAQQKESELRLAQAEDLVRDELANGRSALDTRSASLEAAKRAVELSQESLALIRAQHDSGRATQLDLLQAQDTLVSSEVSLAQARFDLALADLELRRAAGTFPGR